MTFSMHFNFIFHNNANMKAYVGETKWGIHLESHLSLFTTDWRLSVFSNGHNQIELSFQPCTHITRRQSCEATCWSFVLSHLSRSVEREESFPGGDSKCFTSLCCSDTAESQASDNTYLKSRNYSVTTISCFRFRSKLLTWCTFIHAES